MASKFDYINCRATGYWGRDIKCRISSEFIPDKVLSSHYDQIAAMGLPLALWREASYVENNLPACSCVKDTSKQPDMPCAQCYGTGTVPGYFKFGTRNYWAAAITPGWTLNNVILNIDNRPSLLTLAPTAVFGTAVSPNITISTAGKLAAWEAKADAFTRENAGNSTIVVEASIDAGATWFALSALESNNPTTQIMFRVSFTRTTTAIKSPVFEIVRARFPTMLDTIHEELEEPVIRVIPTWEVEAESRTMSGVTMDQTGQNFWTLPLYFFDGSIPTNSILARVEDDAFIEVRYGGEIGFRKPMIEFRYSDTFGTFTKQEFSLRRAVGERNSKIIGEQYVRVF